jgi:serine/threonine protein kinase
MILLYRCSFASDIWGAGLCVYELMTLKYPFNESNYYGLTNDIIKVPIDLTNYNYSSPVKDLVLSMLERVYIYICYIFWIGSKKACIYQEADIKSCY